ncbi:MAG: thiol protease/hemagglutinin PrtT [Muribaculaceae bacterium]
MKKLLLSLFAILMVLPVWAKQIDPSDAKDVASKFVRKTTRLKSLAGDSDPLLAYIASTGSVNNFYVYNLAKGGFVIVAADDCVEQVLGYSENGSFNINAIPENMRYMLDEYTNEINFAIEHSQDVVTPSSVAFAATEMTNERTAVPPLLTTKWNQSSPFNGKCPMYDEESRCVTGCVATAMAQVMNYFEWPKTGQGSNTYAWSGKEISLDFSTITFNWDNMLDEYDSSATDAQNDAVATLMYCAGVSVNMHYGLSSGAASTDAYKAFINYFDYDKSLTHTYRIFYSPSEWNGLVYNEVANGRPVYYSGRNSSSGHAFVCDGYSSDNFFHINWGWGGLSDGYFKLSALNPSAQGAGGSSSGYNSDQMIIYGFAPNKGTTDISYSLGIDGDFECATTDVAAADVANTAITFATGSRLYQLCNVTQTCAVNLGVDVVNDQTQESTFISSSPHSYDSGLWAYYLYSLAFSASSFVQLGDGNYTIYPAFNNTTFGISGRIMVPYGKQNAVKLTVSNGALTFSAVEYERPEIKVESFAIEANLYSNKPYKVNLTVSNSGAEFIGNLYAAFFDENDEVVANSYCLFEITKGKTETGAIVDKLPDVEAGNYTLAVCTLTKDGAFQPMASMSVVVNEEPEDFELANEGFTFDGEIDCSDFKTTCRVTNVGGLFGGVFLAYVYVRGDDNALKSVANFSSDYCLIDKNTTKEISFAGSFDGVPGQECYIYLFYRDTAWHQVGYSTKFTLPYKSAIDDVVANLHNEGFTFDDELNCRDFITTCRVTNTGDAVGGKYFAKLYSVGNDDELLFKKQLNSVSCVINKNATKEFTFTDAFDGVVGQEYAVCLFFDSGNEQHQLGKETRFVLKKNEEPGLVNKGFTFDDEINCLDFNAVCRVTNRGKKVAGDFYATIYDNEGQFVTSIFRESWFNNESCVIDKYETKELTFSGKFDGVVGQEYNIYLIFVEEGTDTGNQVGDGTKFTVTKNEEAGLLNEGFTFDEEIDCSDFKATCRVTNRGKKVVGDFHASIYDNEGHHVKDLVNESCVIDENETKYIEFSGSFSGVVGQEYRIDLVFYEEGETVGFQVGDGTKFTVTKNESGLINEGFTFDDEIDCSDFKATCRLTNKGEKVEGYFYAYIYDNEQHRVASFFNESCVIDKNETKELTFTGEFNGVVGQEYNIYLYTTIANVWQQVGGGTKFTLTSSSGIDDVVADAVNGVAVYPNPAADMVYVESGSAMGNIAVYSLSGQKVLAADAGGEQRAALQVENLQSGVYVVKVSTQEGEVVSRMIKK